MVFYAGLKLDGGSFFQIVVVAVERTHAQNWMHYLDMSDGSNQKLFLVRGINDCEDFFKSKFYGHFALRAMGL